MGADEMCENIFVDLKCSILKKYKQIMKQMEIWIDTHKIHNMDILNNVFALQTA